VPLLGNELHTTDGVSDTNTKRRAIRGTCSSTLDVLRISGERLRAATARPSNPVMPGKATRRSLGRVAHGRQPRTQPAIRERPLPRGEILAEPAGHRLVEMH